MVLYDRPGISIRHAALKRTAKLSNKLELLLFDSQDHKLNHYNIFIVPKSRMIGTSAFSVNVVAAKN